MIKPLYLTPLFAGLLAVTGCDDTASGLQKDTREALNNAAEGAQEIAQKVEHATEHADDEVAQFRAERREDIDDLEAKIDQLDERARNATEAVRAQTVSQARAFDQRRAKLNADLDKLESAAGSQWAQTKATVSAGIQELERDVDQALDGLSPTSERALD